MTEKLYLEDPYLREWSAKVTGLVKVAGKTFVTLDKTAFHPQGGGQPGDRGKIGEESVLDTIVREGELLHEVFGEAPSGEVSCSIDWSFRFPLMQLHTGEHLFVSSLKGLLPDLEVDKVFFSQEGGKIFLSGCEISLQDLLSAEERTNSLIASRVPVKSNFFETVEEAKAAFPAARLKEDRISGRIRILEIKETDYAACSGTHLKNTSEIGFFKILWVNRNGAATEVSFGAGEAAISRTRELANRVVEIGLALQLEPDKVVPAVLNTRKENLELRQNVRSLSKEVLKGLKATLAPEKVGNYSAYLASFDGALDRQDLADLAKTLASKENSVAVLFGGIESEFASLVLASERTGLDMNKLAGKILPLVEGRGGGKPSFITAACRKKEKIPEALEEARNWLSSL
jgi:alanyl-tRNA synthetase